MLLFGYIDLGGPEEAVRCVHCFSFPQPPTGSEQMWALLSPGLTALFMPVRGWAGSEAGGGGDF